jgi:cytochrome c peroxidase
MKRVVLSSVVVLPLALAIACRRDPLPQPVAITLPRIRELGPGRINPRLLHRFRPVAGQAPLAAAPSTTALVALGRMLWYDARLSGKGRLSCDTCHRLADYGVDGQSLSKDGEGRSGRRNTPTVFNAARQFVQFWDGRVRTLEEQALGPILGRREMASSRSLVEETLRALPGYQSVFRAAFPGQRQPVTLENVAIALGAFEQGLVTTSRWDAYLAGDATVLTAAELAGLRTFLGVGCVGCHTGPQVGASMFQKAGVVEAWPTRDDQGRFEVTHQESDRMVFKVPTLRNIARTGPYFHDGSCATLPEAVRLMGLRQLGVDLAQDEVDSIVAFLGALTGALPSEYLARPALPPALRQPVPAELGHVVIR